MQVSVLRGIGQVAVEERTIPEPAADEVLVKVGSVGVCGSDVHYFEHGRIGRYVVDSPLVLGHEAGGVVATVGAEVARCRWDSGFPSNRGYPVAPAGSAWQASTTCAPTSDSSPLLPMTARSASSWRCPPHSSTPSRTASATTRLVCSNRSRSASGRAAAPWWRPAAPCWLPGRGRSG